MLIEKKKTKQKSNIEWGYNAMTWTHAYKLI